MVRFLILLVSLLPMISPAAEPVKWTAHWIMHPGTEPGSHTVVLFRKQFTLESKPGSFIIHVSADNHYRLFVNGNYVTRGPARGDPGHWFYETIDIAEYLQPGENLLAAEVVNWGARRSFSVISQITSFLLQGNSEAEAMVNTLDGSWKTLHNQAHYPKIVDWMNDRTTIDFGFYAGNPTDSIRGDQYPWGWETPAYRDTSWLPAAWADVAGGRGTRHAGGIRYPGGKLLVPRTVPLLKETAVPFGRIRSTIGLAEGNSYINNMGSLVIPANEYVILLIDQTHLTTGYPEMIVSKGKDAIIQVMYAETLISDNRTEKGNRNEIEGKYMAGIKDVFVPDGGSNRMFKPTGIRTFRYVQLNIETFSEPLIFENYYHVEARAPLELKAEFNAGDPLTDWIMEAGWRTISLCAQDYLLADAYYEQLQYTGNARVHNLALLAMSGDDHLMRNSLVQADQSRIPEGLTRACYPSSFHLVIPSYSLIWIDQIYDYMLWKDDREFIAGFAMGIQSVLRWFEQRMQPNGLLGEISWWAALGYPRHYKNGEPPGAGEGNNILYSLHYAYTLRHAAAVFSYLGDGALARKYTYEADRIVRAVNRNSKNAEGFYTESPRNSQVSQITNIMAILADAVTGNEARELMEKLLEPGMEFGRVDLFLHLYLFEALNKTGLQEHFLSELAEWQLMMERGMTTFPEIPLEWGEENQRSECHPWSSSPNYFFFRTVCGINPLEPGHRKIEIAPAPGSLTELKAVYPHHLGNIELNLIHNAPSLVGEVTIPEGMEATFIWNGHRIRLQAGLHEVAF